MELQQLLQEHYHYPEFKTGQEEVINHLLAGESTLAILPTGAGKSMCYQLYQKIVQKPILIVSPLISLMQDQVDQLQFMGDKKVIALNSQLHGSERQYVLAHLFAYDFIYISPELLANETILKQLQQLDLGLFVVDEAHCISQWGPDFRPDYLNLGKMRTALGEPLTLCLTATATKQVISDVKEFVGVADLKIVQASVDRPNIYLMTRHFTTEAAKEAALINALNQINGPGVIYFSSKKQANEIAWLIRQQTAKKVGVYHADLSLEERFTIQHQFLDDELEVICATNAFGMGINKRNIRYVFHYHAPSTLENYLQEIGRAGRDGQQSLACLLVGPNDYHLQCNLIHHSIATASELNYYFFNAGLINENFPQSLQTLKALIEMGYPQAQIDQFLTKRRQEKIIGLNNVFKYINQTTCKRHFLTHYFDETSEPAYCVLNCCAAEHPEKIKDVLQTINQLALTKQPMAATPLTYQDVLVQLFNPDFK